jgi:type III restriction enzyme
VDWANRLILGDSLQVMASLATREDIAGKVQAIYFDPPYGIAYRSNWQAKTNSRTVTDKAVDFKTTRAVVATVHSHINQVVGDTGTWEQIATFKLEEAVQQGSVGFYARNEGMGLTIPYDFMGVDHAYEPDFLVRMAGSDGLDLTLVLEIKGFEDDQTKAKHAGARRWVSAVNNWGRLGQWSFHVCRNPQVLDRELAYLSGRANAAA